MAEPCIDAEVAVALVDGWLEPARGAVIDRHLVECERCRRTVAAAAASRATHPGGPPQPHDPAGFGDRVGRYELRELVGRGAMGTVYRAWDPRLGRDVALKVVRAAELGGADELARLGREAHALARLQHPNVVAVHDAGEHGDGMYITMELVSGAPLDAWLAERPRPTAAVLALLAQAAAGIAAAHAAGVLHRDVKPANLVVGADGRLRVVDFGLARIATRAEGADRDASTQLAETRELAGTPAYMAPEQRRGLADERSDLYALCVTAWEALYGTRPAGADMPTPRTRRVPARVVRMLRRGLAPEPSTRLADLQALARALEPRSRGHLVAIAGLGSLAAISIVLVLRGGTPVDSCTSAQDTTARLDAELRQHLRARFAASTLPHAASAADRVDRALAMWTTRWHDVAVATCAVPAEREVRQRCLDEQRTIMLRLVDQLRPSEPRDVAVAAAAVHGLPTPDACASAAPAAAIPTASLGALIEALAIAEVELLLGHFDGAATAGLALEQRAAEAGAPSLAARAALVTGAAAHKQLRFAAAEEALARAADHAARARDDRLMARVWLRRTDLLIYLRRFDAAETLLESAEAAITRAGGDEALRAERSIVRGNLHWERAAYAEAVTTYGEAEALLHAALGPTHPAIAVVMISRGGALVDGGEAAAGERVIGEALQRLEHSVGREHYEHARGLTFRGKAELVAGRPADAIATLEPIVPLIEELMGVTYGDLGWSLSILGRARVEVGHVDRGIADLRRARQLFLTAYGSDDVLVAQTLGQLGLALWRRDQVGDRAEALTLGREARRIFVLRGATEDVAELDAWVRARAPEVPWP